ncbi:MAG: gamma-glutamylcyclotransferase [Beijerinckiaceae bacterium]
MNGERWVFGYGSLMWRPGFAYAEKRHARIRGYRRSLCIYSHVHRGTPESPGLVLGLDRGGACRGIAFRVEEADWPQTLAYLREREQATSVYLETSHTLVFDDGSVRRGIAYTVDRKHIQYAGRLTVDDMLPFVIQGIGQSGPNPEYVLNTYAHLCELGVRDDALARLAERLKEYQAPDGGVSRGT